MKIKVVHVKDFGKRSKFIHGKDLYIYCGRPSKLSNPFFMSSESSRGEVISKFSENKPSETISALYEYCVAHKVEKLFLGCFCAPKACHCDVIREDILQMLT